MITTEQIIKAHRFLGSLIPALSGSKETLRKAKITFR